GRLRALRADGDAAAGAGGQHHQAHDGGAADADTVLLDGHVGVILADELDELGRSAGVKAPLVDDHHLLAEHALSHFPLRTWLATLMYLRPATCASCRAAAMSSPRRTLESLISIGRLTPAMTSTLPGLITDIARFDGVPPNMSVRMMTPAPVSARDTASTMSLRRFSISSSAPMQTVSKFCCGPTTCSTARRNSSARPPWVTRTIPIMLEPDTQAPI